MVDNDNKIPKTNHKTSSTTSVTITRITLFNFTFQLHFAALASLKSEINDLQKQVKKVTAERDSYRRTLKESRDEKDRLIMKYEERLHEQEQQVMITVWVVCKFLIPYRFKSIFRVLVSNPRVIILNFTNKRPGNKQ